MRCLSKKKVLIVWSVIVAIHDHHTRTVAMNAIGVRVVRGAATEAPKWTPVCIAYMHALCSVAELFLRRLKWVSHGFRESKA
jgi:hypothetical protein